MIIATAIVSTLLALTLLASGVMKVRRVPAVVDDLIPLGVPEPAIPVLGTLEFATTLGLLAGLFWWPLGVVAAIGSTIYFVGAVVMQPPRTRLRHRLRSGVSARLGLRLGADTWVFLTHNSLQPQGG